MDLHDLALRLRALLRRPRSGRGAGCREAGGGADGRLAEKDVQREIQRLREELGSLRAEHARAVKVQAEAMALLRCQAPEKIPHALRNLLNQVVLLEEVLGSRPRNG